MNFSDALKGIKAGMAMRRVGWNGKGLYVAIHRPTDGGHMNLPFLFLGYPDDAPTTPGGRVPWHPSQTDILADDWEIASS